MEFCYQKLLGGQNHVKKLWEDGHLLQFFYLQLNSEFLQSLKEMKFPAVILAVANALSDSAANYLMVNELNL